MDSLAAIIPQPMSTPTAAGMIAPRVGITDPMVDPTPTWTSGIAATCECTNGSRATCSSCCTASQVTSSVQMRTGTGVWSIVRLTVMAPHSLAAALDDTRMASIGNRRMKWLTAWTEIKPVFCSLTQRRSELASGTGTTTRATISLRGTVTTRREAMSTICSIREATVCRRSAGLSAGDRWPMARSLRVEGLLPAAYIPQAPPIEFAEGRRTGGHAARETP